MSNFQTHYDNLQISETASIEVIKGAFRYLAQKWHPDKNPSEKDEAERVMRLINEAYAILSDPVLRKEYDDWIISQRNHDNFNSQPHNSPPISQVRLAQTSSGYSGYCRACECESNFLISDNNSWGQAAIGVAEEFLIQPLGMFGKLVRSFREGDFVGKEIVCDKCNAKMVICGSCRTYQDNQVNPYCTVCGRYVGE